ncbi:Polyribonucleotide nucleotidyltransferase [Candidatus Phytoplasma australiense]|uniref:Polyribonucleotide nucleotidyltransferase n=1 Tax=Phytoplasma australiense TaxID=59748 RepID=PNP_PHYAS|nr:RecName: Full=Polyribonucleotide nucleotidyltransferase; AltName: Full=Polynucleotide phosphorylase; Short=PNPase [Candidatus Phytoplasma australiense]CAM12008.1 Polyribonucleotide nucleotidyltransferase [Candidatus Phytoplasma australiense]
MLKQVFETTDLKNSFQVEIGTYARNVDPSVLIRFQDTVVLTTTVFSNKKNNFDFLPLTVIYQEKFYAAGKIPGSFLRREGRSTDHEILSSRLIDRSLRPLFPKEFRQEIQVINTVLSSNPDFKSEIASILGSSLSLLISEIPFFEPVAGVYVAYIQNQFVINPNAQQLTNSPLHLLVAGTKKNVVMIEAHASEVSEEMFLEAIVFAHEYIKKLCLFQEDVQKKVGQTKKLIDLDAELQSLEKEFNEQYHEQTRTLVANVFEQDQKNDLQVFKKKILAKAQQKAFVKTIDQITFFDVEEQKNYLLLIENLFQKLFNQEMRNYIIKNKKRPDKRTLEEVRNLDSQIDLLPRPHGSALFTRGQTQSLAVVTLGTLSESKIIDDLSGESNKRFMLHYNFPPFAVGSIGRYAAPSRREIGHGNLAEKAILPLLPEENDFPYAIRVVSEILESNGSSSQATVCATSMSLMAAGVPLKRAVSGIAMGLFMDSKTNEYVILSDIQGLEDHIGDMDLKIAGSDKGITALQMDLKIEGISQAILKQAFFQAKKGRLHILEHMNKTIASPRKEMSQYAPKVQMFQIKPEKIRDVIGSAGKIINQIIENHDGVKIDIEQDGRIFVMHSNLETVKQAILFIKNLIQDAEVNSIYHAHISRFLNDKAGNILGAFAQVSPSIEGLIRFSKAKKENDVVKIGDKVLVKCVKINERGRIDFVLISKK